MPLQILLLMSLDPVTGLQDELLEEYDANTSEKHYYTVNANKLLQSYTTTTTTTTTTYYYHYYYYYYYDYYYDYYYHYSTPIRRDPPRVPNESHMLWCAL